MTSATIDLQEASEHPHCPSLSQLTSWVDAALKFSDDDNQGCELTIRIVDNEESQSLNKQYRGKDKPTNVLSFPFEAPAQIELDLLGDLVICAPIVAREAKKQEKPELAHWAHMVVHGTLHLQGYDHIDDEEAECMEALEIKILQSLGFNDPYNIDDSAADSSDPKISGNETSDSQLSEKQLSNTEPSS